MDEIVINGIELTQKEFDLYKKGTTIDDIVKLRETNLTDAEKEKRAFEQKIAKLFELVNDKDEVVMMHQDKKGWHYNNGYVELYIEIKGIKLFESKLLNEGLIVDEIKLYVNQDNNIFETVDIYSLDSLIEFLNDCVEWVDKVQKVMEACPF